MKFENMSPEDQKLVNTEFAPELEKEAAAEVMVANEMYDAGFSNLAVATADEIDKLAAEDEKEDKEKDKEEKMDEEGEKRAADLSAFIERGYFDGLRKLGMERHGDENAYLYPFIQVKLAETAPAAAASLGAKMKGLFGKAKSAVGSAAGAGKDKAIAAAKKMHEVGKKGGYHAAGGAAAGLAAGEAHGRSAAKKQ